MKLVLRILAITKALALGASLYAQTDPLATAKFFNAAEHHHIGMLRASCQGRKVTGRTSLAAIQPGENLVFSGEVIIDSSFRAGHIDRQECTLRTEGTFMVEFVTMTDDGKGSVSIVNPTRDHSQVFRVLPRKGCDNSDSAVCYCDDPMDIAGGIIASDVWNEYGCPMTEFARPIIEGSTFSFDPPPENWRPGDLLCVPGVAPGEKTEYVAIVPSAVPITEDVESGAFWTVPDDLPRVMVEVLDPARVRFTYSRGPSFDPKRFTVDPPLKTAHRDWLGRFPMVANLARSITYESAEWGVNAGRGHMMLMEAPPGVHQYVACYGMGRTRADIPHTGVRFDPTSFEVISGTKEQLGDRHNQKARYAFWHAHNRVGRVGEPHLFIGCVTYDFPKIGNNAHGDTVKWVRCVTAKGHGSGFFSENGIESGEAVDCFAADIRCPGHTLSNNSHQARAAIDDWGYEGGAVWLQGGGIAVLGGYFYDCNEAVRHYGHPIGEIPQRTFPVANLRNGNFKSLLVTQGKTLTDVLSVNVVVKDIEALNCTDAIAIQYAQVGDPTEISFKAVDVANQLFWSSYSWAGINVRGSDGASARCHHGYNNQSNNAHRILFTDFSLEHSGYGLEYAVRGGSTFKTYTEIRGVKFSGAGAHDIRLTPVTKGTFNADIREVNSRADGPVRVVGP